jgi:hypothetical protein
MSFSNSYMLNTKIVCHQTPGTFKEKSMMRALNGYLVYDASEINLISVREEKSVVKATYAFIDKPNRKITATFGN